MLPFTKRPGRDESEDGDVVTKDDLPKSSPASIPPPPVSKRSVSPPPASTASSASSAGAMRPKFVSAGEEEMTTLMPTKSLGNAIKEAMASPRPAAGAPPPSHPAPSSRPVSSTRSGKFAAVDEEEDGRTVVRGAPKIVKRTAPPNGNKMGMPTAPTTISPAAVIKASLDAARAGIKKTGDHLMAGPPADLLEDIADLAGDAKRAKPERPEGFELSRPDVGAEHTAILQAPSSSGLPLIQVQALSTQAMQPQSVVHGTIPPGSARPLTNPPPPNSSPTSSQNLGYAATQSGPYPAQYNGSITGGSITGGSAPGVQMPAQSMPAHFMVAQAPYSDPRMDPPATAVTARTKVAGRPAMSWALALAAFGLFVGVGAVAAMNNNDGIAETSATFVDPSRAAAPVAKAAAAPQAPAAPAAAPPTPDQPGAVVGVPPVAVPAAGAAPAASASAAALAAAAPVAAAPVAAAPAAAPAAPPVAVAPAAAAPTAKVAAAPRAIAAPRAPAAPRPPPEEKEPVAAAPPTKGGKKGAAAAGGKSDVDEETRKALDALQKSQLESSF